MAVSEDGWTLLSAGRDKAWPTILNLASSYILQMISAYMGVYGLAL